MTCQQSLSSLHGVSQGKKGKEVEAHYRQNAKPRSVELHKIMADLGYLWFPEGTVVGRKQQTGDHR